MISVFCKSKSFHVDEVILVLKGIYILKFLESVFANDFSDRFNSILMYQNNCQKSFLYTTFNRYFTYSTLLTELEIGESGDFYFSWKKRKGEITPKLYLMIYQRVFSKCLILLLYDLFLFTSFYQLKGFSKFGIDVYLNIGCKWGD